MKINNNISAKTVEYLAIETIKNGYKIPSTLKSQMTPVVIKMIERKVKFFKKNKQAFEDAVAKMEAEAKAVMSDSSSNETPLDSSSEQPVVNDSVEVVEGEVID